MKKFHWAFTSCISWIMLFPILSSAQDWKTVLNDTAYFSAGKIPNRKGNLLRAIWIDSSTVNGVDTTFHFYKTLRDTAYNTCVDTLGDTWLGNRYVRLNDGRELYFNSVKDTIFIHTKATINDTWTIAQSIDGTVYQGTISAIDTLSIDGVADSVKTILINSYFNGNPVTDWYDGKRLIISKNHGWVKALDFYRFPNTIITSQQLGAFIDSTIHTRLPKTIKYYDYDSTHLLKLYAAGNEWEHITYPDRWGSIIIQQDSVISSQLISPTAIQATIQSSIFSEIVNPPKSISTSFTQRTSTKVFVLPTGSTVLENVLPEYFNSHSPQIGPPQSNGYPYWLVDTFCNMYIISSHQFNAMNYLWAVNNCLQIIGSVSGWTVEEKSYLLGFDIIGTVNNQHNGTGTSFMHNEKYSYIRFGNCVMGTKTNMAALSINDLGYDNSVTISPNPAQRTFTVKGLHNQKTIFTIYDLMGKMILSGVYKTETDISALPAGMYIISFKNEKSIINKKLLIDR